MKFNYRSFEDLCKRKQTELRLARAKDAGEPTDRRKGFMCKADLLRDYWPRLDIEQLFPEANFDEAFRERIGDHYIVLLTILISIGWPTSVKEKGFRRIFKNEFLRKPNLLEKLKDDKLPLKNVDDFGDLLSTNFKNSFQDGQNYFLPHTIIEDLEGIQTLSKERLLPFVGEPEERGKGQFGIVYKATIARGCFVTEKKGTNSRQMVVACKRFLMRENFELEGWNVKKLRESNVPRDHIVDYYCNIEYSGSYYIFSEYTDLGDLEVFMNAGHKKATDKNGTQRLTEQYVFADIFKHPSPSQVIEQLMHLADALRWLHDISPHAANTEWAHMDIKPNNILIYHSRANSVSNAGHWRLADFGISTYTVRRARTETDSSGSVHVPSIKGGTMNSRTLTSRPGHYDAPELQHATSEQPRRRHCDEWAFGCVVNEVFAFISGDMDETGVKARKSLTQFRDTKFNREDGGSNWHTTDKNGDRKYMLKESVTDWLDRFKEDKEDTGWRHDMSELVLRMLEIEPSKRESAKSAMEKLKSIKGKCKDFGMESPLSRQNTHPQPAESQIPHKGDASSSAQPNIEYSASDPSKQEANLLSATLKKHEVKSFDIAPDASVAALLFRHGKIFNVSLYRFGNGGVEHHFRLSQDHLGHGVAWTRVTLGVNLLVVHNTGGKEMNCLLFQIDDIQNPKQIPLPSEWPQDFRDIICSQDTVIWETKDRRSIWTWKVGSRSPSQLKKFDHAIQHKCLSAYGNSLFVWAPLGNFLGDGFKILRYQITQDRPLFKHADLSNEITREKSANTIWASHSGKFCVIQEIVGHARYLISFEHPTKRIEIKEPKLTKMNWISTLLDHALLTTRVVSRLSGDIIEVYRRPIRIAQEPEIDENETKVLQVKGIDKETLQMVACLANGAEKIVLLDQSGKFLVHETRLLTATSSQG